ncbi:MAG: alcohol dehydrogenase catalytic domain-containing protein [Chloroflexi bacterium]|nr:alcohol dehydrogenase catalytic domain-containing protein [Chloroflexota bacterium]
MLAVGMLRGKPGVHSFEVPMPEIKRPDEVLIRMKEIGLDGTDFNIVRYNLQDIAEGRNEIVLGHEGVGVVEEVGSEVKSLAPGDIVAITVRRGCEECQPCLHNQSDMCMTGRFTERGIHKLDGLLTRFVVDQEQYIVKVPPEIKRLAVFTEPLSIAEKGVEQIRIIQSRLPWYCPHAEHGFLSKDWGGCKVALVIGAGPLGLLTTALLRLAKAYIFVADIVPEDHPKVHLIKDMRVKYIDARAKTPEEVVNLCCSPTGELNIILEASGAADTALRLIPFMSRSSIYVMTGIPRGELKIELDAAELVRQVVRYNQVIVGSVNSNRRHFEMALKDIGDINERLHGMLNEMITRRFRLEDCQKAFTLDDPKHIKTVIEVEPWD